MRISILIVLAGLLMGQGGAPANLVVWGIGSTGALSAGEGSVTFFAVYAEGNLGAPVAEKRLGDDSCNLWPSGSITCNAASSRVGDSQSFSLSAGNYELRSYVRGCDGNCGNLRQAVFECRQPFSLKTGETLYIRRDGSAAGCTLTSTPTRLQVLGAGNLSGRILRSDGTPAARVRIGAIRREGGIGPFRGAETDSAGQYLLQNVPEGEYYLAVFEADKETFFPGVAAQAAATVVRVTNTSDPGRFDFSLPTR